MWKRIAAAYIKFKPADGRFHTPEECRKTWDQLRTVVSRFAGLYENNTRMLTSGQTMEDAKRMALQQFSDPGKHGSFKHWDSYVVLMESEKFWAGPLAGQSGKRSTCPATIAAVPVPPTSPAMPKIFRPLARLTAAVSRLDKRRQCGCLWDALAAGPRRSSRQPLQQPSHLPRCLV